MKDLFGHVKIPNFDAASYIDKTSSNSTKNAPNIGIAVSGGGYRSLFTGGGALEAFDNRTVNSTNPDHLGGLLQSSTYLTGLSGGSWLVGSIYMNNFSSVSQLQTHGDNARIWQFSNTVFEGPYTSIIQIVDTVEYWHDLIDAVDGKSNAGYPVSITDYWYGHPTCSTSKTNGSRGRALSWQLINATHGGPNYTWSSIAQTPHFQNGDVPMPAIVADARYPGATKVKLNATEMEFNPWEFGTWDPTINGFVPMEFLGSRFIDGQLPQDESCVRGYDNAGFAMGTSSSIFNSFAVKLDTTNLPDFAKSALSSILGDLRKENETIALYGPNPFYHYHNQPFASQQTLDLADGGENGENIPLHSLIQPNRNVDVILAIDSSADVNNWPDGSALVRTYERSLNSTGIGKGTAFPSIPGQSTFINQGLNTRPTFFGCNTSNLTGPAPLIIYLPNYPYITYSNVSTFDLDYSNSQRDAILTNGYDVATMANNTRDANWTSCAACAILSRSFERTNTRVPDFCSTCFDKYCWDGTVDNSNHPPYSPNAVLGTVSTGSDASGGSNKSAAAIIMPSVFGILVAVGTTLLNLGW